MLVDQQKQRQQHKTVSLRASEGASPGAALPSASDLQSSETIHVCCSSLPVLLAFLANLLGSPAILKVLVDQGRLSQFDT